MGGVGVHPPGIVCGERRRVNASDRESKGSALAPGKRPSPAPLREGG
ncbi:hypothetical protein AKJ08_0399 [Vulgatibacter incomptus]|uniref:Uncharacterized protein n=1 Tax=Vulgatibacter incomptus TaxID=1391653 RepID=A0A0K1P928_9BACT|nr:hypothetical protein AKJ08_0399 [Vulgatibacter incomptus]